MGDDLGIARLIDVLRAVESGPSTLSMVCRRTSFHEVTVRRYLVFCVKNGLVTAVSSRSGREGYVYSATPRGRNLVGNIRVLGSSRPARRAP